MYNKINIYFLPFAGGSKFSYHKFSKLATPFINIIPIDIPGRGSRMKEPFLHSMEEIAADIFYQIQGELHFPYALFGHSLGSIAGLLVTRKIISNNINPPLHLFFSGRAGPCRPSKDTNLHSVSYPELISRLRAMDGTPADVLENQDLMKFFEPVIRADSLALSTYQYKAAGPFDIPVTVLIGDQEGVSYEEAHAWQQETTLPIKIRQLAGKHFFIFQQAEMITQLMTSQLLQTIHRNGREA
jgi:surfactin synthase thioesterase subunit